MTHDEIIMLRAPSGARRLYVISIRPDSTATGAVFKDSLSFSTEQSLHRETGQQPLRCNCVRGTNSLLYQLEQSATGWDGALPVALGAIYLGF